VLLVGENSVVPCRDVDILVEPRQDVGVGKWLVAGRCDEEELIGFQERADGFLRRASGLVPLVHEGVDIDIDDRSFTLLLSVVNPADDWYDGVHERVVVHTVLTMEGYGLRIVITI